MYVWVVLVLGVGEDFSSFHLRNRTGRPLSDGRYWSPGVTRRGRGLVSTTGVDPRDGYDPIRRVVIR